MGPSFDSDYERSPIRVHSLPIWVRKMPILRDTPGHSGIAIVSPRLIGSGRPGRPLFYYQIWQRSAAGRTIESPGLQLNALAKAGMLESGPNTRNLAIGCGSADTSSRANWGRIFCAQICA